MLALPSAFRRAIGVFAPVFSRPVWPPVQVLLPGAVRAPGPRTVTAMLRMMGRSAAPALQTEPRVLKRAVWSPRTARRVLLRLLVAVCIPRGGVSGGLDAPIERRRGEQSKAQGLYRAPGRASHTPVVTARGRRGLACRVLTSLSWADRVWARPSLIPHPPVLRGPQGGPALQGNAGRPWRRWWRTSRRRGPRCRWTSGRGKAPGRSRSPRTRRSGRTRANRLGPAAGS